MNIDLSKRKEGQKQTFKLCWLREQFSKLRRMIGEEIMSDTELKKFLIQQYESKKKDFNGRLFNNVDNENTIMNIENYINNYLNKDIILSGYNTLYKTHDDAINIGSMALDALLSNRKKNKKKMEAAEYGSEEYIYYKVLQLTFKVLANSYYGILGEKNSIFYNAFVQNAITTSGQDLITTSIISMECFLDNNFKFKDIDDFFTYADNILNENYTCNVTDYVRKKTFSEVAEYFISKLPEDTNTVLVDDLLEKLSDEELNRLYWKNNTREIIREDWFANKLKEITQYEYTTEINENIKDDLDELKNRVIEFCFYNHLFYDKYMRALEDTRDVICTIDTDSNFININGFVKDTFNVLNWNVENVSETQNATIVNIYVYIVTEALAKTFWLLTGNFGIPEEIRPKINMKNEFLYKRLLLTRNKKSYGGVILSELGRILKNPVTDIKGLSIRKTTIPKKLRTELTNLLTEDILKPKKINLKQILDKIDVIEKDIYDSLHSGEVLYTLPKNIELISTYANPSTLEQVRGAIIWNALEPEDQIIPPEKVNLIKLTTATPDHPALLRLKETHPEKFNIIMKICFEGNNQLDMSRFGFSSIAIPKSVEKIPDYLLDLIDYDSMVNLNVSNSYILLESLGIYVAAETDSNKYKSNIVEI